LTQRRVLVTGAGGFIGSHLTEALLRRGDSVRAFVRYNSRNEWGWLDACPADLRPNLEVVSGDVCDPFGVRSAMAGCDLVFHLAALIAIPYSYNSPSSYVTVNVNGTLNVLQAARDLGISRIVSTSTSEVYGTARFTPITEDHPLQGQSPYSATKIAADQLALSFHRSFGLPVAICRPFNTFGPRQSARAVIPAIVIQILSGERRIRLGSLRPRREFNYVSDTVDGFLAVAEASSVVGEVVNIGNGFDVSIGELAHTIADIMGVGVELHQEATRVRPDASEVDLLQASHDKATRLTGWIPKCGDRPGLMRGLTNTIDWLRQPENLRSYKTQIYNI
jgi:NAD dependent epimerase/dehydratase